jgi:hypothetical protein
MDGDEGKGMKGKKERRSGRAGEREKKPLRPQTSNLKFQISNPIETDSGFGIDIQGSVGADRCVCPVDWPDIYA